MKINDKVICVEPGMIFLTKGKKYLIKKVRKLFKRDNGKWFLGISVIDDHGELFGCFPGQFKKI